MPLPAPLSPLIVDDLVRMALKEDLGRAGDITAQATIPANREARAVFRAREPGVVAGTAFIEAAFRLVGFGTMTMIHKTDGSRIEKGDIIAEVNGTGRTILSGERVALNFLGRLSGIATETARYVAEVQHTRASIVCTRKTTPGLRAIEKYAVRCGGGMNHRFGLDDAILIKDNHIAVAGGVKPALEAARAHAGHLVKIEIEVDDLDQLEAVLATGLADVVMLDNMPPAMLAEGVRRVAGQIKVEASGGVRLDTVRAIAESGVDMISVGALTHSVKVLDIGLDIDM
ncbi:MAG: carboxylating nicotinate-nucleotide diphosphorylase [Rhizobiales bacterium]|nr:carboxylating nicotinate-nucleotide diphosphorylase [Hyphomicrobiales bacterium]